MHTVYLPVSETVCVGVIAVVTVSDRAFVFVCSGVQECVTMHV